MNGLLIGRFQPFHQGHLKAVRYALSKVQNLWIGIGSSNKSQEKRNPFAADERKQMILNSLELDYYHDNNGCNSINDNNNNNDHSESKVKSRVKIFYIPDIGDHEKWTYHVDSIVPSYDVVFSNDDFTKRLFEKRQIKVIEVPFLDREKFSGTRIRELIANDNDWQQFVPAGTRKVLEQIDSQKRLSEIL